MTLKLKDYDHSYYCHDRNHYVGLAMGETWGQTKEYSSWAAAKEEFELLDLDIDMNLIFRWDIKPDQDPNTEEFIGTWRLHLYMMHQRKGAFRPIIISNIEEKDLEEIEAFLIQHWTHLKSMWEPISEQELEKDIQLNNK